MVQRFLDTAVNTVLFCSQVSSNLITRLWGGLVDADYPTSSADECKENMYYIKRYLLRLLFKTLRKTPLSMPMVDYWKKQQMIQARVRKVKDGTTVMDLEGMKHPLLGYPRGHLLFGPLSKLKHEIKNQVFNESWEMDIDDTIVHVKQKITGALDEYLEAIRYEMVPFERMNKPTKELWRAFSVIEQQEPQIKWLKEAVCTIMQEDDAYRLRVQWLIGIFNPSSWFCFNPIKDLEIGLTEMEHAEVTEDMKGRIRLLRTIIMRCLNDPKIYNLFLRFCKEVDWNKLKLTEGDKYHFRAKYFKVDLDKFEY
jgi:hypothetical protein